MDVMPIYIIDRKFPDTSGESLTHAPRALRGTRRRSACVSVRARIGVCAVLYLIDFFCVCARVLVSVRACRLGDTGQRAPVDHAPPSLEFPTCNRRWGAGTRWAATCPVEKHRVSQVNVRVTGVKNKTKTKTKTILMGGTGGV